MRKILFLTFLLVLMSLSSNSQDLLKGKDLSQLKVDMINASDLAKLKNQINSAGLTLDQAEQMAISKGMPASEAAKLKQKLSMSSTNASEQKNNTNDKSSPNRENSEPDQLDGNKLKEVKDKSFIDPLIFGSELYTSSTLNFEPNLKLATPINYILGPEDQIQISVFGVQEYNGSHTVSPEGSISIPNVGEIRLAGMTIELATQKLQSVMGNSVYNYLKTGGAKLSVSLTRIRTISVTIIGSNKPGNYKLSSLSSVFNALFVAGGPSAFGSFREIELIRNNKIERKIDLYKFLFEGSQKDNIGLKDNDVIRIPTYKIRVELKGEIKRPGIFEVLPGESFNNVLQYASGFTDSAYMNSVKVIQRNEKEKQILDLTSNLYANYKPQTGDLFEVSKILDRYRNRVYISGAIFRPGQYELKEGMTISDLIGKADGIKLDAYKSRAQIFRYGNQLSRTILSFDVAKAIDGKQSDNYLLKREDSVVINSVFDLKEKFHVSIQGEIRKPGKYDFIESMTLKDLILQSGNFTDAAYKKIEIARLEKKDSLLVEDSKTSIILKTEIINKELSNDGIANIQLQPFDVITVRRLAGYQLPESVIINGQVQYPGPYTISDRTERVSDIIKRAGGFAPDAYPDGAFIKRFKTKTEKEVSEDAAKKLSKDKLDTLENGAQEILRDFDKIPLDLENILKHPGSVQDIILKSQDEINIPKFDSQIKISGEVLVATQVPLQNNYKLTDYIDAAGGFTSNALRRKIFVVYPNGRASATKHFLFIKTYPKIKPGSEIVVPKKREKKSTSITEIVGITSVLASLVTTFVLLNK